METNDRLVQRIIELGDRIAELLDHNAALERELGEARKLLSAEVLNRLRKPPTPSPTDDGGEDA